MMKAARPAPNALLGPGGAALSAIFALTMAYVGLGSFFFHAGMTKVGHKLDMAAVYALCWTPAVYILARHFQRARRARPRVFVPAVGSLMLAAIVASYFERDEQGVPQYFWTSSADVVPIFALADYVLIPTNVLVPCPASFGRVRVRVAKGGPPPKASAEHR